MRSHSSAATVVDPKSCHCHFPTPTNIHDTLLQYLVGLRLESVALARPRRRRRRTAVPSGQERLQRPDHRVEPDDLRVDRVVRRPRRCNVLEHWRTLGQVDLEASVDVLVQRLITRENSQSMSHRANS
jgi:hypothetical protein